MTLADYHPSINEPAVILALALSTLVLVAGGFLIFRPVARGATFSLRLLAAQLAGVAALVLCATLVESVVVRSYYVVSKNPNAGLVCSQWVQRSPLPYVLALPLIAVLLLLTWRRGVRAGRAARSSPT
jgi:hypothetical protein